VEARLERRAAGRKHAADDLLFDYYPFSPAKLSTWHPGFGVGQTELMESTAPLRERLRDDLRAISGAYREWHETWAFMGDADEVKKR